MRQQKMSEKIFTSFKCGSMKKNKNQRKNIYININPPSHLCGWKILVLINYFVRLKNLLLINYLQNVHVSQSLKQINKLCYNIFENIHKYISTLSDINYEIRFFKKYMNIN